MEILSLLTGAALSAIPSAVFGILSHKITRKIDQQDEKQAERSKSGQLLLLSVMEETHASLALGQANAVALKNGHTNGETDKALAYAQDVEQRHSELLMKISVKNTDS